MAWLKANASWLLPVVLAVVLPLVGILLTAQAAAMKDRERALRIGAATVLGIFVYLLVFES
jgi:hypothetical protein